MYDYEMNSEEALIPIDVNWLDHDLTIHNDLEDPAEKIICILNSSLKEEEQQSPAKLKHNVILSGSSAPIHILLQNKIHFTLDQFQNFDDIVVEKAFKEDANLETINAFNNNTDLGYWYSAIDIKTIGEQIIDQQAVKLYEPVDGVNNLAPVLRRMQSDIDENSAGILVCNILGSHWISLALVKSANTYSLLYKDSLYEESAIQRTVASLAETLSINLIVSNSCEQRDMSSCGIFALQNIRMLSEKIQSCLGNEGNMNNLLVEFSENNLAFCTQEEANILRIEEFAEQYIVGKYNQAQIEYAETDLYAAVRHNHIAELDYIREKLSTVLQRFEIDKRIIIEGEDTIINDDSIKLEIAIDHSLPFASNNYSYLYTLRWDDNALAQSALMDMLIGNEPDIKVAAEHLQHQGKAIRLNFLAPGHERAVNKLNFEDIDYGANFVLDLNGFLQESIRSRDIDNVKAVLDRNHLLYMDNYVAPSLDDVVIMDAAKLNKQNDLLKNKNLEKALNEGAIKLNLATIDSVNLTKVIIAIKALKPALASNSSVEQGLLSKIDLNSIDKLVEIKSLLIINALFDVTRTSEFEYKPEIFILPKITSLLLEAIKEKNTGKINLCINILVLAGQNNQFVSNISVINQALMQLNINDKGFSELSGLILNHANYNLAENNTLHNNSLEELHYILTCAIKLQNHKLISQIKSIFDDVLKLAVFDVLRDSLTQTQREEEQQKIAIYIKATALMGGDGHEWQSNLLDKLLLLIEVIPEMQYAQAIDDLLQKNPILKDGRNYKLHKLLQIINEKLPEANSLISSLIDYQQSPSSVLQMGHLEEAKTLESLLQELLEKNKVNAVLINAAHRHYQMILTLYQEDSIQQPQGLAICDWQEVHFMDFIKAINDEKDKNGSNNKFTPEETLEFLAIIKRANIITSGNDPRDTQMLSVLLMLKLENHKAKDAGLLLQIATGEGKSTTTAMLAAIKALQGHKVDIITSSKILAQRDAENENNQQFFALLGLTVSHNTNAANNHAKGLKECYKADVVYGDVGNFQYDWIYHNFKQYGTRGDRAHEVVIVDEVDSMLIDESAKIAMVSSRLPGAEYLQGIYAAMWQFMSVLDHQTVHQNDDFLYVNGAYSLGENGEIILDDPENGSIYGIDIDINEFRQERIEDYTRRLVMSNQIEVPSHLKQYTLDQANEWTKSLLRAKSMSLEKDYIIIKDDKNHQRIAPVDYAATGVISKNTQWSDALHQFIQLKHSLRITAETLSTCYISNTHYFKLYGENIFGMSGTLGSSDARDFLCEVYNIEIIDIPTYQPKKFSELAPRIADNQEEYLQALGNAVQDQLSSNRAVLIIAESIVQAKNIHESLSANFNISRLKLYTRTDNDEAMNIAANVNVGDVIVATNIAGRGTDLKTSLQLEKNGGLHVIVSYLPMNLRVEQQAFGRTSRQENDGTAELVVNAEDLPNGFVQEGVYEDISIIKLLRDALESKRIKQAKLYDALVIELEDKLFSSFVNFYQKLKNDNKDDGSIDCTDKLRQLEERFGFLLKSIKQAHKTDKQEIIKLLDNDNFEILAKQHFKALKSSTWQQFNEFKLYTGNEFNSGTDLMRDSFLLVRSAVNSMGANYKQSLALLSKAMEIETNHYNFSAQYNHAYALIRQESMACKEKNKAMTEYIGEAHQDLLNAKHHIDNFVIPNIEAISMLAGAGDTDLLAQTQERIKLFKLYVEHITKVCQKLESFKDTTGRKYIEVSENKLLQEYFPDDDTPIDEIAALNSLGLGSIFDVREASIPINYWDAALVAILGCIQIVVGLMLVCTGNVSFGTSCVMAGIGDLVIAYKITQGEAFEWKEYFSQKAVQYAIAIVALGCEKLADTAGMTLFKGGGKVMTLGSAIKTVVIRGAIGYGVDAGLDYMQHQIVKNIIEEFEGKIHRTVTKQINSVLNSDDFTDKFQYIMSFDQSNGSNKLQMELQSASHAVIREKVLAVKNVIKGIMSKIGSGQGVIGTVGKVVSLTMSSYEVVNAISQIDNLAEDVAMAVNAKAAELLKKSGQIEHFLAQNIGCHPNRAKEIAQVLKLNGFVRAGAGVCGSDELVAERILASKEENGLDSLQLVGNLRGMERRVIDSIKDLYYAQNADYSSAHESLKETLIDQVESSVKNKLRNKVFNPILSEASSGLRQATSDKAQDLYNYCFDSEQYNIDQVKREKIAKAKEAEEARIKATEQRLAANDNQQEYYQQLEAVSGSGSRYHSWRGSGISAGDGTLKQRAEVVDISPDKELLDKLQQIFELDQDSEIARMLKGRKESPKPTRTATGGIEIPGIYITQPDQTKLIYDVNEHRSTFRTSGFSSGVKNNNSQSTFGYVVKELFGAPDAYGNPARPAAGAIAINSSEGYTDSRVRQAVDFPFVIRSAPGSGAGSFFSGIDFSPEQNSPTDRIAGTDFYGRPAPSFSVTRDNNSQSTFGYVVSELFGIQSAQAAVPFVIGAGAGAAEALTYSAGALGLGTAWWSLNNAATGASEYKATSNYSRENSYQPALTGNLMTSGMNTGLFANPVDQMRFDGTMPEVDEQTPRTNIVANKGRTMPIRETETSSLLKGMDTSSDRPAITDFSIQHKPKSILPTYTPDQSTELAELTRLPGFSPSMLEAWQESFPDDSHKLEEFSNLPGFSPSMLKAWQESFPVHEEDINDLIFYKDYPDTVEKINDRYPINGDLAGQKYPVEKLPKELQVKYPNSVMIDERGFVRFEPYSISIIRSKELIGDHDKDFQLADEISGYETRPEEYTWHHADDGETMVLVPKDLHKAIRHTGGAAIIRATKGGSNGK